MTTERYTATTRDIVVSVSVWYLAEQSDPEERRFVWAYRVNIHNMGSEPIKLLSRTWLIVDGAARTLKIEGVGVVGEQPCLDAGEAFEYTSGTPLDTPSGLMRGSYHMVAPRSGERFDIEIPAFSLDRPGAKIH